MKKYAIVTDSSCDLSKEYREAHHIDYAKMLLNWPLANGEIREEIADLDWQAFSMREFYDLLRNGTRITTSLITPQNYREVFEKHLEKGEDVLYLACSSGLTASWKVAEKLIQDELTAKYPNNKVVLLDTLRAGMSQGQIVMLAVEAQENGKSLDEVIELVEKEKLHYKEIGIPDTLKYLKRAGRVSAPAAYFGNLVGLKPILVFDEKGSNIAIEKAIGRKKAFAMMAEIIKNDIINPENQTIYLMHADCSDDDINAFKNMVNSAAKVKEIVVMPLGPIIGASSGPGTVIINYYGK